MATDYAHMTLILCGGSVEYQTFLYVMKIVFTIARMKDPTTVLVLALGLLPLIFWWNVSRRGSFEKFSGKSGAARARILLYSICTAQY